ncbi:hypothetical protein ACGF0J_26650 [Nonomuraea sp. NPDC047897]|jgi:hypothetical protein|uniref:hypothetical protein n=1 Tax=Nonomuraea sp. NPDC047897 TaxID=3364346 RepID=UPI003722288F
MRDGVRFNEELCATGISMWGEMVSDLKKVWDEATAEIEGHVAAAPWGGGIEGIRFHQALLKKGGPLKMCQVARRVLGDIEEAAPTMRETIAISVAADDFEAERIKRLLMGA